MVILYHLYKLILIIISIMILMTKTTHTKAGGGGSGNTAILFPKITEFLKDKPVYKHRSKLGKCEVDIHKEQCMFRTTPRKAKCLLLYDIVHELMPRYVSLVNRTELRHFKSLSIAEMFINVCTKRLILNTSPQGHFPIIPKVMDLTSVKTGISLPLRFGDFQMFGAGEWALFEMDMKIKFTKENVDLYTIKGYSVIEFLPIKRISDVFNVKMLPKDPISDLLKNMHFDKLMIQECKVYGTIQPYRQNYDLAFSGEPTAREFAGSRIRVFITKVGDIKNLAVLLELQDYSPVTLLKKIYGHKTISKVNVLRDRNQTIALYVSGLPTTNFSNILMSHGSSRWLHRDSTFDPGAYLLVTIPFPKRKAVDMRIQLLPDGLWFSVPESENLPGDVVLGAISPLKIMHIGVDKAATYKNTENSRYKKIKILKFKYFIFNDTYLAAAESNLSVEEELEELMPSGRPELLNDLNRRYYETKQRKRLPTRHSSKLDTFFKREDGELDENFKGKVEEEKKIETGQDVLSIAQQAGIL